MKILHVFRTPVGGLFRHVRDLARGQCELGHEVGIICDSTTGGKVAAELLERTLPFCSLGIERIGISRLPGLGDLSATKTTREHAQKLAVDIIHGHGAKGGLYGRLAARALGIPSVYTPHGGSLHYRWPAFPGFVFLATEWALAQLGSGMIFVCEFERQRFREEDRAWEHAKYRHSQWTVARRIQRHCTRRQCCRCSLTSATCAI